MAQRYYGVGTGRFWSADPSRLNVDWSSSGSWNSFGYVGGDPINSTDASGLYVEKPPDPGTVKYCILCPNDPTCHVIPGCDPTMPALGNTGCIDMPPEDPGDADPISGPGPLVRPECDRSDPNNAQKLDWINSYRTAAATAAAKIGTTEAIILGLSALESGWGQGPYVADGSNNFFSQHAPAPGSNGSVTRNGNHMATYGSYLDSALGFSESASGQLIVNVTDPTKAARLLQDARKYGINGMAQKWLVS